jgi:hypothetical protein
MSAAAAPARTVVNWKSKEAVVIERAARSAGLPVASFVRASALRAARLLLAEAPTIEGLHGWIAAGEAPSAPPAVPAIDTEGVDR